MQILYEIKTYMSCYIGNMVAVLLSDVRTMSYMS